MIALENAGEEKNTTHKSVCFQSALVDLECYHLLSSCDCRRHRIKTIPFSGTIKYLMRSTSSMGIERIQSNVSPIVYCLRLMSFETDGFFLRAGVWRCWMHSVLTWLIKIGTIVCQLESVRAHWVQDLDKSFMEHIWKWRETRGKKYQNGTNHTQLNPIKSFINEAIVRFVSVEWSFSYRQQVIWSNNNRIRANIMHMKIATFWMKKKETVYSCRSMDKEKRWPFSVRKKKKKNILQFSCWLTKQSVSFNSQLNQPYTYSVHDRMEIWSKSTYK